MHTQLKNFLKNKTSLVDAEDVTLCKKHLNHGIESWKDPFHGQRSEKV